MHVYRSMIIDAEIERVWAAVRAFDGVANWNPGMVQATLENGAPTATVTVRALRIPNVMCPRSCLPRPRIMSTK